MSASVKAQEKRNFFLGCAWATLEPNASAAAPALMSARRVILVMTPLPGPRLHSGMRPLITLRAGSRTNQYVIYVLYDIFCFVGSRCRRAWLPAEPGLPVENGAELRLSGAMLTRTSD